MSDDIEAWHARPVFFVANSEQALVFYGGLGFREAWRLEREWNPRRGAARSRWCRDHPLRTLPGLEVDGCSCLSSETRSPSA
jgi:hypothetical protein